MNRSESIKVFSLIVIVVGFLYFFQGPTLPNLEDDSEYVSLNSFYQEYTRWEDRIAAVGAQQAYGELKDTYAGTDDSKQHAMAHIFGELLYTQDGLSGVRVCDDAFMYGCFHSFFIRAISEYGVDVISTLDSYCQKEERPTQCQHGLGHGLLLHLGSEHINTALELCARVHFEELLFGCHHGVLMEYNFPTKTEGLVLSTGPRKIDEHDPFKPCPEVPAEYQIACYYNLPQYWNQVFEIGSEKIIDLCSQVRTDSGSDACFKGAGHSVASNTGYQVDSVRKFCSRAPHSGQYRLCISGASFGFYVLDKSSSKVCGELTNDVQEKYCFDLSEPSPEVKKRYSAL